jgi:hypothetical protein
MAELFRADIHQHVFATRIVAVKSLDRILHRRSHGGTLLTQAAKTGQQPRIRSPRMGQYAQTKALRGTPESRGTT